METTAKLLKTYKAELTDCRFIGRSYGEESKKNDTFGWLRNEWFANDLFAPIEKAALSAVRNGGTLIEDGDAYCGMCVIAADGTFQYWIEMIVPKEAEVPEGYGSFSLPACNAVVNWVYGKEPDVYFHSCIENMEAHGYHWDFSPSGERLMTERYVCPRFTEPDENGNLILDLVYFTNYR